MRLSFVLLFVVSLLAFAQRNTSESNFVQIAAVWQPEAVASDADWSKAIEKGYRLTCRLEATDEGAGRLWYDTRNPPSAQALWSDYTLKQDLELWGWHESEWNDAANCNFADDDDDDDDHENKIGLSLKPLSQGGDNICFNIQHYDDTKTDDDGEEVESQDQYYEVSGRKYRCTGAHVRFSVNHVGGMIMGHDFSSPKNEAELTWDVEDVKEDELPKLKKASDIMLAFWPRNNKNPRNLRHYLANQITNKETVPLIARVLKNSKLSGVPKWPGVEVSMQQDDGQALLGNPLGGMLAFLLAQHKKELGTKHVTSATIFRDNNDDPDDNDPYVYLLYRIEDVDEMDTGVQAIQIGHDIQPRGQADLQNLIRTHKIFNTQDESYIKSS